MMNRRDALKTATALLGGAFLASNGVLVACAPPSDAKSARVLDSADQGLIEEIADTLLPATTASPGARAANIGPAANFILTECYKEADQRRVVQGLKDFRDTCRERRNANFISLARADREDFLRGIVRDAKIVGNQHYFVLVRDLIQGTYFSSEIGTTRALRYIMVPGRYDGCVDLVPGQPAWA